MDLTGDTAETILNEYEGYSIDEMNRMLNDTSITYMAMNNGDLKAKKKMLEEELERIDTILKKREGVLYWIDAQAVHMMEIVKIVIMIYSRQNRK